MSIEQNVRKQIAEELIDLEKKESDKFKKAVLSALIMLLSSD
jgi:hypothetical protein